MEFGVAVVCLFATFRVEGVFVEEVAQHGNFTTARKLGSHFSMSGGHRGPFSSHFDQYQASDDCPVPPSREQLIELCKRAGHPVCPPPPYEPEGSESEVEEERIHMAESCLLEKVTLQCLPEEYIEIQSVFWGRKGKLKCAGSTRGDCIDTDGRALAYMIGQCEYLSSCSVYVDSAADKFGDPCEKAAKLLRVKYKCLSTHNTGIRRDYVCGEETLVLKCPRAKIIRIQYATFGRDRYGINYCRKGKTYMVNCRSWNSVTNMVNKCQNKHGCSQKAYCSAFTAVCPNSDRYLRVAYFCVPDIPVYRGHGTMTEAQKRTRDLGKHIRKGESMEDDSEELYDGSE